MTTWRMSFRAGNQGEEMWPRCFEYQVAAITYVPISTTDLSKLPVGEPKELWAQLKPTQQKSLYRLAYEMRAGDIIYVKKGPKIINRGRVTGSYQFDQDYRIKDGDGVPWPHQVPVEWDRDFPEIPILLGAEQWTVRPLSTEEIDRLQRAIDQTTSLLRKTEFLEGKVYEAQALFRSRNRALIRAKKANCDCRCEACGFSFEETYGDIGHGYIVAHHRDLIAKGQRTTRLEDIALVCANCHAMIHLSQQPLKIEELRARIENQRRKI